MKEKVIIGVPSYDGRIQGQMASSFIFASEGDTVATINVAYSSLLAFTFNRLWTDALNSRVRGWTHFCMLHADVVPEPGWLDKMMKIHRETESDILSVVMPIKNSLGVSSTAIDDNEWEPPRFTMKQLAKMPPTFTSPKLLVNTGLMLVDIRKPWVENIRFHIDDRIIKNEKGEFVMQAKPEDWNFSRDARALGAKIFATQAVAATHYGTQEYDNLGGWGMWDIDKRYGEAKL